MKSVLVRRYSQAFLNVSHASLTLEQAQELSPLAQQLEALPLSLSYVQRALGDEKSCNELIKLFSEIGLGKLFEPLVKILCTQRRLALLPDILRAIYKDYLRRTNVMHFTIESAVDLKKKETDEVVSFLKDKTGSDITYTLKTNESLIAGIKMYSDTLAFEHSIEKKIRQLL